MLVVYQNFPFLDFPHLGKQNYITDHWPTDYFVFIIKMYLCCYRFLPGNENYTLIINMDSISQTISLSDQIPRLYGSLSVVIGSENSNFNPGLVNYNSIEFLLQRTVFFSE